MNVEGGVEIDFDDGIFAGFGDVFDDHVDAAEAGGGGASGAEGDVFVELMDLVGVIEGVAAGGDIGVFAEEDLLAFFGN